MPSRNPAPHWPGIPSRWTSSAKSGVGTALSADSRVWFTISHGVLNEIYYPRIDQACTRDFGLIVTDGHAFFSEEKRNTQSVIRPLADGVPGFHIVSTCSRYRIEKTILCDPRRDVLLQRVVFHATVGRNADYRLFALLAPHLVNRGAHNTAWIDDYKGVPMLFASGSTADCMVDGTNAGTANDGCTTTALALACAQPFLARSAGFVGFSDGWQDLSRNFAMTWQYDEARNGNVALTAEIALPADDSPIVLALGFGRTGAEAALQARASLMDGFDAARAEYVAGWRAWQSTLLPLGAPDAETPYRTSTAVLRTHRAATFSGGYIASLSVPWGFSKGDNDLGGYHLIWPRDLVETAGALLAAGAKGEARQVVYYLNALQEADGHWLQNFWLDGMPYWNGVQMDETAFPILLVDLLRRHDALSDHDVNALWPMVRRAATFILHNGPVTAQDRWEEDGGYSPFTLAVEIAALLVAAEIAERCGADGAYLRATADIWNSLVERWTYARDTALARRLGVAGYYVRVAPPDAADAASPLDGYVPIKNRPPDTSRQLASLTVSPDALALVRFGLRAANDPRIADTVTAIDALLKVDLPTGTAWGRYNGDGYGEHEDGSAFDGTGIGRRWPLLTSERAHFELSLGNRAEAERLRGCLENFGNDGHLLPEQIWDAADIPERELYRGRPSGSAMPLVWAHAEHIKLLRSLKDGSVFDMPPQTRQRYIDDGLRVHTTIWRFNQRATIFAAGDALRIETPNPAIVHWSGDNWKTVREIATADSGWGLYFADLDPGPGTTEIVFTLYWPETKRWEGENFRLTAVPA